MVRLPSQFVLWNSQLAPTGFSQQNYMSSGPERYHLNPSNGLESSAPSIWTWNSGPMDSNFDSGHPAPGLNHPEGIQQGTSVDVVAHRHMLRHPVPLPAIQPSPEILLPPAIPPPSTILPPPAILPPSSTTIPATSGHEATATSSNARSPISPANELLHPCTMSDVDMVTLAPRRLLRSHHRLGSHDVSSQSTPSHRRHSSRTPELSDAQKVALMTDEVKERYRLAICLKHGMQYGILAHTRISDFLRRVADSYRYDMTEVEKKAFFRTVSGKPSVISSN